MTTARCQQVCLDVTPWYHCTTRCVRRAFICGIDSLTQRDYNHRRLWIEERILLLGQVFCIDVGAYAIMSNHYHVVVKVDRDFALALTDIEVVQRWLIIYSGNDIAQKFNKGEPLSSDELVSLATHIERWRTELANLSRFMAEINQNIARRANSEDGCKGRFWEARFDSQAVLDYDALLRTMIYVDLNPVRANICKTPELSRHTSVYRRLNAPTTGLLPFAPKDAVNANLETFYLPITFEDYLTLLDWTSRQIHVNKRGRIPATTPSIFQRLKYSPEQWMNSQHSIVSWKQKALGSIECIAEYCEKLGRRWIWQAPEHKIST